MSTSLVAFKPSQDPALTQMPHSTEAERAVLACILLAPQANMPIATERIGGHHFYLQSHREIFLSMDRVWVHDGADSIDLRTVQADLEDRGKWQMTGGIAYLAGLDLDLPDLGKMANYVAIVLERWTRRRIIEVSMEAIAHSQNGSSADGDLVGALQRKLMEIQSGLDSTDGYQQAAEGIEGMNLELPPDAVLGVSTGLVDLDSAILGLEPGCLYVVAGRPGHGKTALAVTLMLNMARAGVPVGMVSLEMMLPQLSGRLLSQMTDIPHRSIKRRYLSHEQRARITAAGAELAKLPIWIDSTSTQTADRIAARAHRLKEEHDIQVLFVDYLGLVEGGNRESETIRLGEISRRCKLLSKDLQIRVVLVHQLNRECEKRTDKRPVSSDLRSTGALEQDADVLIMVFREEEYSDDPELKGLAELIVRKNRNGQRCTVESIWIGELMQFKDPSR